MTIISITGALYTHSDKTVEILSSKLGYPVLTDAEIIKQTAENQKINIETIIKVANSKQIPFNDFNHEREKIIACLKRTIARHLEADNIIFYGILGHLIPNWVSHVMRVLIIEEKENRIQNGIHITGKTEKEATHDVNDADKHAIVWVNEITGKKAWDPSLYDIVAPSDKLTESDTVSLIIDNHANLLSMSASLVKKEVEDFKLATRVEMALSVKGDGLLYFANNGHVVVTIDKNVLLLTKFKQKITTMAKQIEGVASVEIKIGKNYYKSDTIHNFDFKTPLHVLLVDDEKEFVQTLSQRLKIRQINSNVVYNGEDALKSAHHQNADVMVLDLKMPGIDGIEVLREIKKSKPHIEVIILTGHGTEKDRQTCLDLGAFAYLQKPADIDLLADTMKRAYEKIDLNKNK